MLNPNPDILLYIGMADSFAAGAEYLKLPEQNTLLKEILKFEKYYPHPSGELAPGAYTDDTEMSIANAKGLITLFPQSWNQDSIARLYWEEFFVGGSRKGYSKAFQAILETAMSPEDLRAKLIPNSIANGACMRAAVLGVIPSVQQVCLQAYTQAIVTHNTPEGIFSAQAVALMSHFALYTTWDFETIAETTGCLLKEYSKFQHVFWERWNGSPVVNNGIESVAITTVHAVVDLLCYHTSLMDILRTLIQWGGDTDSVAAVAWGIASCRYREEKLPAFLYEGIENPAYLRATGTKLMNKFHKE